MLSGWLIGGFIEDMTVSQMKWFHNNERNKNQCSKKAKLSCLKRIGNTCLKSPAAPTAAAAELYSFSAFRKGCKSMNKCFCS